jgi:hypothetical protein
MFSIPPNSSSSTHFYPQQVTMWAHRFSGEGAAAGTADYDVMGQAAMAFRVISAVLFFSADRLGVGPVRERMNYYYAKLGHYWRPAKLIARSRQEGRDVEPSRPEAISQGKACRLRARLKRVLRMFYACFREPSAGRWGYNFARPTRLKSVTRSRSWLIKTEGNGTDAQV